MAISGIYSPIDREFTQEEYVRDIMNVELPDVRVTISKEVANIGECGFCDVQASWLWAVALRSKVRWLRHYRTGLAANSTCLCLWSRDRVRRYWYSDDPPHLTLRAFLGVRSTPTYHKRLFSRASANKHHGRTYETNSQGSSIARTLQYSMLRFYTSPPRQSPAFKHQFERYSLTVPCS